MTLVRRDYWIPRLMQLTKKVINNCFGCKKCRATAFHSPPPGNLTTDLTIGSTPFQIIGVDYVGPLEYKINATKNGKAHFLLFTCSHLLRELCSNYVQWSYHDCDIPHKTEEVTELNPRAKES